MNEIIPLRQWHFHTTNEHVTPILNNLIDYQHCTCLKAKMAAYAEDLCTITGGPNRAFIQTLQAKWLSTFCTFTGMVLHPNQIKPTIVPILPEIKAYKYLAVHLDLRNKSIQAFNKLLHMAPPPWIADHQD